MKPVLMLVTQDRHGQGLSDGSRIGVEARPVGGRESDGSDYAGRATRHAIRLQALRQAALLADDFFHRRARGSMVGAGIPLAGSPEQTRPANPGFVQPAAGENQ